MPDLSGTNAGLSVVPGQAPATYCGDDETECGPVEPKFVTLAAGDGGVGLGGTDMCECFTRGEKYSTRQRLTAQPYHWCMGEYPSEVQEEEMKLVTNKIAKLSL